MPRLITFGDSFTYGHGLVDCPVTIEYASMVPSKFAWPQLLGNVLNLEVVNNAQPGWSNIQILREILNFKFIESDLVIVGWTYSLRDCIFSKDQYNNESAMRLSVWHKDTKFIEKYFDVHNDYDMAVRQGLYIHHAECFLKTKNIQQLHFCAYHGSYEVLPSFTLTPEYYREDEIIQHDLDLALDNSHPGPKAHKQASERLYRILNESK